jgi:hypothetical protein
MRLAPLFCLLATLAACTEPPARQTNVAEAMPNIPMPPAASYLSKEIGEEALKIRFRSELDVDAVARYYRGVLSKAPWNLVSDTPTPDGTVALYAEQKDGPPLWVTIRKAEGAPGSFVDLTGAKAR